MNLHPPSTAQSASWLLVLTLVSEAHAFPLFTYLTAAVAWGVVYTAIYVATGSTTSTSAADTDAAAGLMEESWESSSWSSWNWSWGWKWKRKWQPALLATCAFAAETGRSAGGAGGAGAAAALVPVLLAAAWGRAGWKLTAAAGVVGVAGVCALGTEDLVAVVLRAAGTAGVLWVLEREVIELGEHFRLLQDAAAYLIPALLLASVVVEDLLGDVTLWRGSGWRSLAVLNAGGLGAVAARVATVAAVDALRCGIVPVLVVRTAGMGVAGVHLVAALVFALWTAWEAAAAAASALALVAMLVVAGGHVGRAHTAVLVCCVVGLAVVLFGEGDGGGPGARPEKVTSTSGHPIPLLIAAAEERYYSMRGRQSRTLAEAVVEYKRRYGMLPPPHFDAWWAFARARNVVLVDEYDSIYHSLKPFWGLPPDEIRRRARAAMGYRDDLLMKNNRLLHAYIRGGKVEVGGQGQDWQKKATRDMLSGFARWLPDMDLPFNIHDEPRVMVPFDALQKHLADAEKEIAKLDLRKGKSRNSFTPLSREEKSMPPVYHKTSFTGFAHSSIFAHSTLSCPPDSPVRQPHHTKEDHPSGQLLGFIVNATSSSDICLSPSLEHRHGFFDRPNTFNVVKSLYPVFSQSKVSSYGDIVYPSPWYWAHKVPYDEHRDLPWDRKVQKLYWRGSTTGGFSRNGGWKRHHRQRVVSVIDASDTALILERTPTPNSTLTPTNSTTWHTTRVPRESLRSLFNVYFSHIGQCTPSDCSIQSRFFHLAPVAAQHSAWAWKYLLDMDGNAFSGRYHAFLKSRSVVFKLAVFRESHDEWLHPWVHYVPLSLQLDEVAEIMRFFRYEPEGEVFASRIARESRSWARRTLRRQDLEVWMFRLLLEYARVTDKGRGSVGFAG